MAVLFLMEASKKTDKAFCLPAQSTCHTVVDSRKDVDKMTKHLIESSVTAPLDTRLNDEPFPDPTTIGWKKFTTSNWIMDTIHRSAIEGDDDDLQEGDEETDTFYELTDVL